MATPSENRPAELSTAASPALKQAAGETAHLKRVPESLAERGRIRRAAEQCLEHADRSRPLTRNQTESLARRLLAELQLPEAYLGWTMVIVSSAFWRKQVMNIPFERRLLLLPHCMRNRGACRGQYDAVGLHCQQCGECSLGSLEALAKARGYRVLIAEGSPIVMQLLLSGAADAVLGVACLDSLEKAFERILVAGLPAMAVPLWSNSCRDSRTDEDWAREMIETPYRPGTAATRTFLHLLRTAAAMFEPDELERLAPRHWKQAGLAAIDGQPLGQLDPLASTELIAYNFLLRGGKHLRPFITLAAFDAATGAHGTGAAGAEHLARLPDSVRRVALAMEVFHKASLVHDDIEDDDPYRYGYPALHCRFGSSAALNVGDYLIGLGYRLIASQHAELGAETTADILHCLSQAHTKLCEGQGAELAWRDAPPERFTPSDALKMYALKTAPAFEAALFAGLRMAGAAGHLRQPLARFARHLGVAFQIRNDLDDWQQQPANKRAAGRDLAAARPTLLRALAQQLLPPEAWQLVAQLATGALVPDRETLAQLQQCYGQAGVFAHAQQLVDRHRRRAAETADSIDQEPLRQLLHYFVETVTPSTHR